MHPARLGPKEVDTIKRELGSVDFSCQHAQEPLPEIGGMFERGWFEIIPIRDPDPLMRVRFWDAAGSETVRSPYTAGVLMAETRDGHFIIEDVRRDRLTAAKVDRWMLETHRTLLAGFTYSGIVASGDKVTRWKPLASQARPAPKEAFGKVKLVEGPWNKAFLDEVVANRRSKFKDQLDAAAGALQQLRTAPKPIKQLIAWWG